MVYFISSLPPKVRQLARHVRNHWRIENQLHWSLDVSFAEETSRIRKGDGAANAAIFRRLALSLVKRDQSEKRSLRAKRLKASWRFENLLPDLTGITA
ncbi:ISAs1 family transposase [Polystyrenella longa]|uniref:ISAs1 family transposase n=1 Tax=Polystyrenella longa TaxID=2528007 RepID=UPI0011A26582|nr:ISAs1 family transposase [Polystyrenella longa]